MYRLAFQTLRKNYPFFLVYCVLAISFPWIPNAPELAFLLVVPPSVMQLVFRMILLDETYGWKASMRGYLNIPWKISLGFWLRFLAAYVASFAAIMVIIFVVLVVAAMSGDIGASVLGIESELLGSLVLWPGFAVAMAVLGAGLAAAAIGADASYKRTWRLGRIRFWRTLARLMVGPFVLFLMISVIPNSLGDWVSLGQDDWIIIASVNWCIWIFVNLLTATAIAMAYQEATARIEHEDVVSVF